MNDNVKKVSNCTHTSDHFVVSIIRHAETNDATSIFVDMLGTRVTTGHIKPIVVDAVKIW